MCGCRARAAARAAAAAAGAPRTVAVAPRRIPRAPLTRAPLPPATMSVSILTRAVAAPVVAAEAEVQAPQPRSRFQRHRVQFRPRRVVVRPPPPETLVIYDTKVWGPLLWRAIHTAAENTDGRTEFAELWVDFVFELQMSLPCPDCMQHYRAWVASHPWMGSGEEGRQWWLDLHNAVNARKGVEPWSVEEVAAVNVDLQAGRDAVAALATMLGPRAHRVLVALYDRLGS